MPKSVLFEPIWAPPGNAPMWRKHRPEELSVLQLESSSRVGPVQGHIERIAHFSHPFEVDFSNIINMQLNFQYLRGVGPSTVLKILKTWLNGWSTSYRMQDDILKPCLLGCGAGCDAFYHYAQCPHLYAFMRFFNSEFTSGDPLERWALVNCSHETLKLVACAFDGYHAIRRHSRVNTAFNHDFESLSGSLLHSYWTLFAEAFLASARENSIPCRAFSVPSFLAFVQQNMPTPSSLENLPD